MGELNERGKSRAREIDLPVNAIPIMTAADLAHVPHAVALEAVKTRVVLAIRDRAGRLYVSPSAVGILARIGKPGAGPVAAPAPDGGLLARAFSQGWSRADLAAAYKAGRTLEGIVQAGNAPVRSISARSREQLVRGGFTIKKLDEIELETAAEMAAKGR